VRGARGARREELRTASNSSRRHKTNLVEKRKEEKKNPTRPDPCAKITS